MSGLRRTVVLSVHIRLTENIFCAYWCLKMEEDSVFETFKPTGIITLYQPENVLIIINALS